MPHSVSSAEEALARDLDLAAQHLEAVQAQFRKERDRLARDPTKDPVRDNEWAVVLAALWGTGEDETYEPSVTALAPNVVAGETSTFLKDFIKDYVVDAAKGMGDNTRMKIKAVKALKPMNLSRQLRKLYQIEFIQKRAPRVALDQALRQTATFENAAAQKVQDVTGVPLEKVWHNQGDNRVRSTHLSVSSVLLDEPFLVGGTELRYPRDPAGTGRETYGCRCWAEHREASDETITLAEDPQKQLRRTNDARLDEALLDPDRIALGTDANAEVNALAEEVFEDALRKEKRLSKITRDIKDETGADFQHFAERVKYEDSIRDKIFREVKEDPTLTFRQAADKLKDTNRYTLMWDADLDYRANHARAVQAFNDEGWETFTDTNSWIGPDTYDGMNYSFKQGDDIVEIQFHTPESAVIKDISHPIYTEWRSLPDSARKTALYDDILELWDDPLRAHVPPNMLDVGTPKLILGDFGPSYGDTLVAKASRLTPVQQERWRSVGVWLDDNVPADMKSTFDDVLENTVRVGVLKEIDNHPTLGMYIMNPDPDLRTMFLAQRAQPLEPLRQWRLDFDDAYRQKRADVLASGVKQFTPAYERELKAFSFIYKEQNLQPAFVARTVEDMGETIVHEIGHGVDVMTGFDSSTSISFTDTFADIQTQFDTGDIPDMWYAASKPREGFAELFRLYALGDGDLTAIEWREANPSWASTIADQLSA